MEPDRFVDTTYGEVIKTPGQYGYYAFRPSPIPRRIDLDDRTILLLSEADRALGRLAGAGRILPNPHLLVRPYLTREALASNRIEGTQASLSDVFDVDADARAVASLAVRVDRTAMPDRLQGRERQLDDLAARLKSELTEGMNVLVKGSRFMRMERVVDRLRDPQAASGEA